MIQQSRQHFFLFYLAVAVFTSCKTTNGSQLKNIDYSVLKGRTDWLMLNTIYRADQDIQACFKKLQNLGGREFNGNIDHISWNSDKVWSDRITRRCDGWWYFPNALLSAEEIVNELLIPKDGCLIQVDSFVHEYPAYYQTIKFREDPKSYEDADGNIKIEKIGSEVSFKTYNGMKDFKILDPRNDPVWDSDTTREGALTFIIYPKPSRAEKELNGDRGIARSSIGNYWETGQEWSKPIDLDRFPCRPRIKTFKIGEEVEIKSRRYDHNPKIKLTLPILNRLVCDLRQSKNYGSADAIFQILKDKNGEELAVPICGTTIADIYLPPKPFSGNAIE